MSKVVYKYELNATGSPVMLPRGAKVTAVNFQGSRLFIWALVNTKKELTRRIFDAFGTGETIPGSKLFERVFIGTAFSQNGDVVHVFERIDQDPAN